MLNDKFGCFARAVQVATDGQTTVFDPEGEVAITGCSCLTPIANPKLVLKATRVENGIATVAFEAPLAVLHEAFKTRAAPEANVIKEGLCIHQEILDATLAATRRLHVALKELGPLALKVIETPKEQPLRGAHLIPTRIDPPEDGDCFPNDSPLPPHGFTFAEKVASTIAEAHRESLEHIFGRTFRGDLKIAIALKGKENLHLMVEGVSFADVVPVGNAFASSAPRTITVVIWGIKRFAPK